MCGRYTLSSIPDPNQTVLPMDEDFLVEPRYNIAPSQLAAVKPMFDATRIHFFKWGLVPFWAKDAKIGYKMINARSETLHEKASFKKAFQSQRCLVLADGFYEWKRENGVKQAYRIIVNKGSLFYMAGLYDFWQRADGRVLNTFTIITTEPNEIMEDIHNRMPAILDSKTLNSWMDPRMDVTDLRELLSPFDASQMEAYPVSMEVGNVKNDHKGLIKPIVPPPNLFT